MTFENEAYSGFITSAELHTLLSLVWQWQNYQYQEFPPASVDRWVTQYREQYAHFLYKRFYAYRPRVSMTHHT